MMEMDPILLGEILAGTLFFGIIFVLALGFPVAYTLAGTSLMVAAVGWYFEVFDFSNFGALASRYVGFMSSEVLVAVPLFIFMGVLLERSGIAEALLTTMGRLFGNVRGGLGFSVIIVGALLAASTGVVGATVVTMGLISLPAMLRAGYDPKLGAGVIAASGTLGQIIPPSTILIFMGDMLSGINAQVQMSKGNFAPTPVSVGDLFVGAILPSAVLVGLYMLYMAGKAVFDPKSCPATPFQREEGGHGLGREIVTALLPPLALILAVLGSILGGIATPPWVRWARCCSSPSRVASACACCSRPACPRPPSPPWCSPFCWAPRSFPSSSASWAARIWSTPCSPTCRAARWAPSSASCW